MKNQLEQFVCKLVTTKMHQQPLWFIRKFLVNSFMRSFQASYYDFSSNNQSFNAIQIQTQTFCNLNCVFCPNNKIQRQHGLMTITTYKTIINMLAEKNFSGLIQPYLMNEPLIDKRISDLIQYAHEKCPNSKILLSTNGTMLTNQLLRKLFDSGLNFLIINDYTLDVTRKINCFSSFHQNRNRIQVATFPPSLKTRTNRAGLLPSKIPLPLKTFCNRPFRRMYINFKGESILCCCDWTSQQVMGNVNNNNLNQIWTSQIYEQKRNELLCNQRKGICAVCDFIGYQSEWSDIL